jgi:alpha-tubulin suppressor-like RCC1 family protein
VVLRSRCSACYEADAHGELGDDATSDADVPQQVPGLSGVIDVAAGVDYSLAVKADGSVWAWGSNADGQLGDGTTTQRLVPVQVSGISTATAVSAGSGHSLASLSGGTVKAWGSNSNGSWAMARRRSAWRR